MDKVTASQPLDREFEPSWVTTIIHHMTQVLVGQGSGLDGDLNKL